MDNSERQPPTATDGARPLINVAVGVVFNRTGQVLLGQRIANKPYAGWWEFPGGKFEAGEDAQAALARELSEELGIVVEHSDPWLVREHRYEHAHVRLHFRQVKDQDWRGQPAAREGQTLVWCDPAAVQVAPLLPASIEPVRWLGLPRHYWISNATELGTAPFLEALEQRLHDLAQHWADPAARALLLLREPGMEAGAVRILRDAIVARIAAARLGDRLPLLISSRHPELIGTGQVIDSGQVVSSGQLGGSGQRIDTGLHLSGRDLALRLPAHPNAERRTNQRDAPWLAASGHQPRDLIAADRIGADFAVYGPVLASASHPDTAALGWSQLADALAMTPLPTFALGGITPTALDQARRCGAHGIAMQRAVWR